MYRFASDRAFRRPSVQRRVAGASVCSKYPLVLPMVSIPALQSLQGTGEVLEKAGEVLEGTGEVMEETRGVVEKLLTD